MTILESLVASERSVIGYMGQRAMQESQLLEYMPVDDYELMSARAEEYRDIEQFDMDDSILAVHGENDQPEGYSIYWWQNYMYNVLCKLDRLIGQAERNLPISETEIKRIHTNLLAETRNMCQIFREDEITWYPELVSAFTKAFDLAKQYQAKQEYIREARIREQQREHEREQEDAAKISAARKRERERRWARFTDLQQRRTAARQREEERIKAIRANLIKQGIIKEAK